MLAVREVDGSYGVAGVAAAAYLALGAAISRPFHGRWLHRRDATQALVMPSTLNGLAPVGRAIAAALSPTLTTGFIALEQIAPSEFASQPRRSLTAGEPWREQRRRPDRQQRHRGER